MNAMRRIGCVMALAGIASCGDPSPVEWQSHGDRVLGLGTDKAQDPVNGAIVPKKTAVKREFRGTVYFFESDETADDFTKNPEEYAFPPSGNGRAERVELR